jgi:hypothetical protein
VIPLGQVMHTRSEEDEGSLYCICPVVQVVQATQEACITEKIKAKE